MSGNVDNLNLTLVDVLLKKINFYFIILGAKLCNVQIHIHFFHACPVKLLLYLCGTTTNTWLRPVEEDLSMSALSTVRPISDPYVQAIAVHPIRPPGFRSSLISPSIGFSSE
jgi:hypothetical protein